MIYMNNDENITITRCSNTYAVGVEDGKVFEVNFASVESLRESAEKTLARATGNIRRAERWLKVADLLDAYAEQQAVEAKAQRASRAAATRQRNKDNRPAWMS